MTPIGKILFEHDEAKKDYQDACQAVIKCAVEHGIDRKSAEDVRLSIAFLKGLVKGGRNGRG